MLSASPLTTSEDRNRLPAIRLTDLIARERSLNRSTGSCTASWDDTGSVPVRCGSDKTRYLVANLGSNGRLDIESWPALDANNKTATTAVVELFQDGGEVRVRCSPRWIRRDGSSPPSPPFYRNLDYRGPVVQSTLVTQTGKPCFCFEIENYKVSFIFFLLITNFHPQNHNAAGPVYTGEASLAFASKTDDLNQDPDISSRSVSFSYAFTTNSSSPTGSKRYLPRVISCVIKADDPANNGLPVYVIGQYIALANASSPLGIELRPEFVFPL